MAFKPLDDAPAGSVSFRPLDDTEATTPTAADYLKGAASGVGGLVSGIGYLAEAAGANQLGGSIRGIGDTTQRYWQDSMTPAGQRAAQSQVFDDDPGSALPKLGDRWGQALAMGAAQSAPSMLAAAIPGGIAAAGLRGAAGMAASRGIGGALAPLAAGTAAPVGGWATNFAGNLAARAPGALGFGAAEGAVAGASNAAQWKSDIEQKPLAELRKMPGFAALEAQIGEQAARQQIAEQGAADIMARTTLATGGIGALTGGGALGSAFQRVTTGAKGGILGAIGRDAAKEAGQEIPQSGGERAIQNIATRDYLDPNQPVSQGVVADALSGGAIGGLMGGVTGGASHLAKGPLQKAVEASSATIPPDAGIAAGIPAGNAGNAGIPFSPQQQNTPAAPGLSPDPVPAAESSLPTNQAEPAGVPVSQQQQGLASSGNQTEVAKPAEQGQQAQPAAPADTAAEWDQFVRTEGADVGTRRLGLIGQQRRDAADLAGLASAEAADLGPRRVGLMMGQQRAKQAAAKSAAAEASRKGIAAALQTPQQPTTGGGPLPQVATDMPIGKYGIAAAVARPKAKAATPFVAPTLTTREQPKTTSVLPQQAADMPVGRYGAAARRAEKQADAQKQQKPFVAPRFTAKDQPTTTSVLSQQATEMPVGRFGVAAQRAAIAPTAVPAKQNTQFDAKEWDRKRAETIDASRKAGNTHLDKITPSVESMRGIEIYYAHDPKERGVIRTVDNRGNVYVQWLDEYSAKKNSASASEETNRSWLKSRGIRGGSATVFQTLLMPSDLKDYVVSKAEEGAPQPASDTIQAPNGQPFKSQLAARRAASQRGVKDTHDVVPASEVSPGATGFVLRKKPEQKSPARLPPGWTEASPGGIATNKDERTGGIVDVSADGTWFAVANAEGIPTLAGFKSRDDAFAALAAAVERNVRASSPNVSADISPDISGGATESQQPKQTVRQRLLDHARRIGVYVDAGGSTRFFSGNGRVVVPAEDAQVEGAQSADHVFAHELGHATLQKRGLSFDRMPVSQLVRWMPEWKDVRNASKEFRPSVWNHANDRIRRHARTPNEIVADAIASVLLGINDVSLLRKIYAIEPHDAGFSVSSTKDISPDTAASQQPSPAEVQPEIGKDIAAAQQPQDQHIEGKSAEPASDAKISYDEASPTRKDGNDPANAPTEKPESSPDDMEKLQAARQLLADNIETKRLNRQTVPTAWTTKLAEVDAKIRGESDPEAVYSMVVEGHPMFDGSPMLRNLIPIKVTSLAGAERKLFAAQDLYSKLSGDRAKAKNALSVAKTAQQKKAAQKALRDLNDNGVTEDAVDTLRQETLPELQRIVKAAEDKFGSAKPAPAPDAAPAEPTSNAGELPKSPAAVEPLENLEELPAEQQAETQADVADAESPSMQVSKFIQARLAENRKTTWQELFDAAAKAWGSTLADGKYSVKDAYDAMEIGVNLHIRSEEMLIDGDAKEASAFATGLTKLIDLLPTQTKRTAEQDEFQQFSTPPALSYVASWVANIGKSDTMMEPSAGTGDLAIWAEQQGAKLILNELSDRRAKVLQELFPKARVFTENAEQINNTLPADAVPTVVVMNPPFSSTAGRVQGSRNTMNGAKHIEQALKRLADGGRLVAIVGEGMAADRPAFTSWWKAIAKEYNVRANIGIDGKEYAKYGTTFSNQILVFDKTGPTTGDIVTGNVASVSDLPTLLEGIRNDRLPVSQRATDQQEGAVAPEGKQGANGPAPTDRGGATDAVVPGGKSGPATGNVGATAVGGKGPGRGTSETTTPATGEPRPATADATPDANGERGRLPDRPVGDGAGSSGNNAGGVDVSDSGAAATSEQGSLTDSVFENYTPQRLRVTGAKPHPGNLVQSAAMASVEPPAPTYAPNLPRELIDGGKLSVAQIESIVYAGQAHEQFLPNGERRGFFIGDGTGVGKGREIAGIILDNIRQGRKKAVWVSFSEGLINDAQRDFEGIGGDKGKIFWQGKTKPAQPIAEKDGILFTSYSTMKSAEKKQANDTGQKAGKTRLDQIVDWLGADFDGAIVFDEAHSMGNIIAMPGKRGIKKPSQQALAGANLQKMLPKARIVYVSATGATEVSNLGYASRLGLWGEGTAFPGVREFITGIGQGGVAAMELISRDMKALGMYIARSLSFDGVTYQRLDHELTPLQTDIYNELARAWQGVLKNVNEALGITGGDKSGSAKSAAMAAFWGSHQRFFNQVITSLQTPTVIDDMRKQIAAGNALVVQLVNTNEATQEREVAKAQADGTELEELDFTPRQMLLDYVRNSFPVQAFEQSTDDNGNLIMVPVRDAAGNPVFDKDAVAMRERLLKTLEQIRVPGNPIDEIIQAFGSDAVGEVTGRKRRFVSERGEDGAYRIVEEKRGKNAAHNDAAAFQGDKKKILIFSQAGGTGFSFHADNTAVNKRKRVHYILQPGWRADAAVQGFGRSHRTNQASAPIYMLPTTNLKAQKRFVSSIARRLDQLGALTRGQRQATSQGMFSASDNLESQYAADALKNLFNDMYRGNSSLDFGEITGAMGLDGLIDQNGGLNTSKLPEIPQFLNRLLSLESFQQDEVFAEFEKRLDEVVNFAIQTGTYDTGLQTLQAQSIVKVRDEVAHTDPRTGAETRYVEVDVSNPIKYVTKRRALEWAKDYGSQFDGWFKDANGEVFGLAYLGERVNSDGETTYRGVILKINGERRYIDNADQVRRGWRKDSRGDKQTISTRIDDYGEAMTLLEAQIKAAPKTRTKRERMIVGVILPVWDRVQGDAKIVRLQTDSGERMIGRMMSEKEAKQTVKNLGLGASVSKMSTKEIVDSIRAGSVAELANGWQIAQVTVSGEKRLEIRNRSGYFTSGDTNILNDQGVFFERIEWKDRAFIPVGKDGEKVFERVTESKPVVDLVSKSDRSNDDSTRYNVATDTRATPADKAIYGMAAEGKPADEILSFISKASRRPFNRLLATALQKAGLQTTVTTDSQGGWQVGNRSYAQKYAAAYSPKADKVALFTPRDAERHVLHELVHAATLKAIAAGGVSAMRMLALFKHVQKSGKLDGQYGMRNLGEFVAEVFSNPKFRDALQGVPAPANSALKNAWQWFVRIVARIVGIKTQAAETALDRALREGVALMQENAAIRAADEAVRFNLDTEDQFAATERKVGGRAAYDKAKAAGLTKLNYRQWVQVRTPAFKAWFGDWEGDQANASQVVDPATGEPLVVYHGTDVDFSAFDKDKIKSRFPLSIGYHFTTRPSEASMYAANKLGSQVLDGGNVMSAYAMLLNPLIVDTTHPAASMEADLNSGPMFDKIRAARLSGNPHDGIIIRRDRGDEWDGWNVIAFKPEQIKSATGNRGTFDATDPDIRYNIAADWQTAPTRAATTIRQYVADSMRSDSNTSWLTPFNTQYHKAEKWAAEGKVRFKHVFNIVQQFIADTSRFAVMSQNAAPALLHEIKSLRDVKEMLTAKHGTGKQHRADIEAIASPLYDGTLHGQSLTGLIVGGGDADPMKGVKWSDSLLRTKYNLTDRQIKLYHEALAAVKVSMDEMAKSLVARHAKRVGVDFDNGMALDDMVADVAEKMKELQDDVHFEFLSDEAKESHEADILNLMDMDKTDEARKAKSEFVRKQKDAKEKIAEIEKTIADIKAIESKAVALQEHGYFPLMRFGRHTVTAKDREGKTLFFGMYDGIPLVPRSGQAEANRVKREVQAMFPDATVETGIINDEKYKLYQGLNLDAMQIFAEHMDKDDLAPVQEFIRLATNSRSAMKRLMHREGTPGFDRDVRRTLAQFIVSNARSAASNYHNADMLRAAEEANKDGGDIGREAVRLVKYIQNPEEEAQVLRGFLFFQFLGGSIASAVVNLTQTPAMTLPFLSKFEPAGRLSRRLLSAAKMAVGDPKDIADAPLRDALMTAEMDGVTAPQEIHQLVATAANNLFAGSRTATVFLRGWGAPFAMAESVNRRIAFISAFRIAQGMGKDLKAKTGFATPFEFAEDAVNQTQGLYNKGNRMNVGRGAFGATVMTFKQFSIMYLELLKRLPPKQRAIMLGVLLISAGGGGLPGVEDAEDIWDTIGQWLGFASNSKRTVRNTLTDWTNPEIADLAINGLLSKMGIDLHSRLGMQNLLPGTAMLKQSSTDKGREITEVFGPAASVIKSVGDALEKLATGQPAGAAKALVPGAIRNAWQGVEMAATGRAEDARGRATVPVNEAESIAKVIGFNPKSVAQRGEVNRGLWQDQRLIEVKREGFTADIVSAILAGDDEAKTEAYDAMRAWNEDNPQHRVTINPATIGKRVREARSEGTARMVRALPKAMRQQAAEEFAR